MIHNPQNAWGELERAGNMLTELGFASEEKRLKAEYYDQRNAAELEMAQMYEKYENDLDQNDTAKWGAGLEAKQKAVVDGILARTTNPQLSYEIGAITEGKKFEQTQRLNNLRISVDANNFRDRYHTNRKTFIDLAANSPDKATYNLNRLSYIDSLYGFIPKEGADLSTVEPEDFETKPDYDTTMFNSSEELRYDQLRGFLLETDTKFGEQQNLAVYHNAQDNIALNPESFKPEDYPGLKPTQVVALREYAHGVKAFNENQHNELTGKQIQAIHQLAIKNISPDIVTKKIDESDALTPEQKTEAWNVYNNAIKVRAKTGEDLYGSRPTVKFSEIRQGVLDGTIKKESQIYEWTGKKEGYGQPQEAYLLRLLKGDESKAKALEDTAAGKNLQKLIDFNLDPDDPDEAELNQFASDKAIGLLQDYIDNNPDATDTDKKVQAIKISRDLKEENESGALERKLESIVNPPKPQPKDTQAGKINGKNWGVHQGDGSILLTEHGVRLLINKFGGDVERIRAFVKERNYIIPE